MILSSRMLYIVFFCILRSLGTVNMDCNQCDYDRGTIALFLWKTVRFGQFEN